MAPISTCPHCRGKAVQTLSTGTTTQSPYYLTSPSARVPHQCVESSSHGAGLEGSPGPGTATVFRNADHNSQPTHVPHLSCQAAGAGVSSQAFAGPWASTAEGARTQKSLVRGSRADAGVPLLELGGGGGRREGGGEWGVGGGVGGTPISCWGSRPALKLVII